MPPAPIPAPVPDEDADLPPCPERPDCCLGGCAVCVLDGYEDEVEAWRKQVETLRAQRRASMPPPDTAQGL